LAVEIPPTQAARGAAPPLAYFLTTMVLYNIWQLVNMMLATEGEKRRTEGYLVTMPFMVTVLGAHLNGRL